MAAFLLSFVCALCLASVGTAQEARHAPGVAAPGSFIHPLHDAGHGRFHIRTQVYTPQAGDLVFYDDHSPKWAKLYKMVGSGPPFHSGIAVRLPDGRAAFLEAGPDDTFYCNLLEAVPRLQSFEGTIYIRRVKQPLCQQACDRLTQFALAQEGKRYALGRLLLQGTPFRARTPLQRQLFGATYIDRCSWLCSELVVAAGTTAGLFNPKVHLANSIYPRDIVTDWKYPDLGVVFEPPALWTPTPSFAGKALWPR